MMLSFDKKEIKMSDIEALMPGYKPDDLKRIERDFVKNEMKKDLRRMKNNSSQRGISFAGILFIVLLVLKVAEIGVVANWSWWWVTAPLWIPFALTIAIIIIAAIVMFIMSRLK